MNINLLIFKSLSININDSRTHSHSHIHTHSLTHAFTNSLSVILSLYLDISFHITSTRCPLRYRSDIASRAGSDEVALRRMCGRMSGWMCDDWKDVMQADEWREEPQMDEWVCSRVCIENNRLIYDVWMDTPTWKERRGLGGERQSVELVALVMA